MSKTTRTAIWHLFIVLVTVLSVAMAIVAGWDGHNYAEGAFELAWAILLRVMYPEAWGK